MVHPFNTAGATMRLIEEYNKYKRLIIGFDFDNTIYDYHHNDGNYSEIICVLQMAKKHGFILCLYTTEEDPQKLEPKLDWCRQFGITPDYINESPVMSKAKKPYFNLLLDDRAGLESAYESLFQLLKFIRENANS